MEHKTRNKLYKILFSVSFLVAIDQLSKYIIRHGGGFYICNPNVAFGIQIPLVVFWFFWMGIISLVILEVYKSSTQEELNLYKIAALVLILAGALANIIDRIVLGCVVDFIDLGFWPVFNLADLSISLGAVILLVKWKKMC
jgi:signal peptidase II